MKHGIGIGVMMGLVSLRVLAADAYEMTEAERKVIEQKMAGTYNPLSLYDGKVVFDAQERLRGEYRANNSRMNDDLDKDTDEFLLQRFRAGLALKPLPTLKLYGQVQDSREINSTRVTPLGDVNLEEAHLDVRQLWIDVSNILESAFSAKLGRQELVYGDERLIGSFDWNNVGRVFDAAKIRWQEGKFSADLFAANVVLNNVFSSKDETFDDEADSADDFYGIYTQCTAPKSYNADVYVLYRDKNDAEFDGPAREIWSFGTRLKTKPRTAPWDGYTELVAQSGEIDSPGQAANRRFGDNATNSTVDHVAYAMVVGGGYTMVDQPWAPRLGLEYNYASGDKDPTDGENNTFENLFPTNHKFYGFEDLFAWKNIHNPHALVTVQPSTKLKMQLDGNAFWLAEDKDFWYRANQAPAAPGRRNAKGGAGSYVGSEIDLTFWWTFNKQLSFHGGYAHFFAGDFVEDTAGVPDVANGSDDADFAYLQTAVAF